MKQALGWTWPDRETHLLEWVEKHGIPMHGRPAYQGKKQVACFREVVKRRPTPLRTAIDVGGHIGLWSYNMANLFEHVHAFEPVEEHRQCFRENLKGFDNVELLPYALGAAPGLVDMQQNPTSTGDTWAKPGTSVEMRTIDSFGFQNVEFVKVDVEGGEELALRGAVETLKRWRPVVCVEQKRTMAADRFGLQTLGAVVFLNSLGYRVAEEISGDFICVPA